MRFLLLGSLLFAALGCASGGSGGADVGTVDAGPCSPGCVAGDICVDGRCVVPGTDRDGDGIPVEADCNDRSEEVGRTGTRSCGGECSAQSCTDGVWGECTEGECNCTPDDPPRSEPCGLCGTRTQVCRNGEYEPTGGCMNEGVCEPGSLETDDCPGGTRRRVCVDECTWTEWECDAVGPDECTAGQIDREQEPCGDGGMRERSRTCVDGSWGAWSAFGSCDEPVRDCAPGATENETEACGNCDAGTRTRTRTCGDDGRWMPFGAFGACSGGGTCAPGETSDCVGDEPCGVRRCGATCEWGGCEPRMPGGCLWENGSNFQCCTPPGGGPGWQFCSSTSCQWFDCVSNSCS